MKYKTRTFVKTGRETELKSGKKKNVAQNLVRKRENNFNYKFKIIRSLPDNRNGKHAKKIVKMFDRQFWGLKFLVNQIRSQNLLVKTLSVKDDSQ